MKEGMKSVNGENEKDEERKKRNERLSKNIKE